MTSTSSPLPHQASKPVRHYPSHLSFILVLETYFATSNKSQLSSLCETGLGLRFSRKNITALTQQSVALVSDLWCFCLLEKIHT